MTISLVEISSVFPLLRGTLHALCNPEILVPLDIGLNIVFLAAIAYAYRPYLSQTFALYNDNPPRHGAPGLDPHHFLEFFDNYKHRCRLNMMASLAVILSTTVYLNIEAVKAQAPEHLVLQALMVITMANAISGLYLSVLFADVLEEVRVSYGLTISWVQGAVALSTPGAATVLATPFGMTGSAIMSFILYRVAAAALFVVELDEETYRSKGDAEQYIALAVMAYIALVVVHTAVAAKTFIKLKAPAAIVTTSLIEAK